MSDAEPISAASPPVFNAPPIVLATILVLSAVHALFWWLGEDARIWSLYAFSFIPARLGGGLDIPAPRGAMAWSFVSYAFLHADWMHLLFNSIWLLIFGTPVARYCGAWRFVAISLIAAIGGSLATLALHWGAFLTLVGASGAVSGLMAAAIPVMYGGGRALSPRRLLAHRRALLFMAVWLGVTLVTGASGLGGAPFAGLNIAWEAHIGGFLAGLLAFYALGATPRRWRGGAGFDIVRPQRDSSSGGSP